MKTKTQRHFLYMQIIAKKTYDSLILVLLVPYYNTYGLRLAYDNCRKQVVSRICSVAVLERVSR